MSNPSVDRIGDLKRDPTEILFWGKSNKKYWPFSNFYPSPVWVDKKRWPTTEHYYQAQKTTIPKEQEAIRMQSKAWAARQIGREVKCIPNWDDIKDEVMLIAIRAKFTQNEVCRGLLLSTGDLPIHEDSPSDFYWGHRYGGKDMLGKILIIIRQELRQLL